MFQGCSEDVPTMVLPTMEVSWVGVLKMLQEGFNSVSRNSYWCFIGFQRYFLDCFKGVMGVSMLSYGCFNNISMMFQ